MNFFAELKRRNVFRVAVFYIVCAWVAVQVAETLLPVFAVPDVAIRIIVLILALGFPLALLASWVFEMTPQGIRRESDIQGDDAGSSRHSARKLNWATLTMALLAIALLTVDRMIPEARDETPPSELSSGPVTEEPAGADEVAERASIAVLPFVNMSMDPGNEYFADGISEELLNILAGIDGLKVASRTSAFSFKGSTTPIPEIAERLNVRHVLEGSVRKAGNRVRITAQLIDASDDAHLWSEVYDRELDDIFAVQEDIAQAITGELESLLGTRQVDVAAPTRNMDAYQLYLRGRSRFYGRQELNEAVQDLRAAVDQDPDFAEAWAFLAALYWLHGNGGYQSDYDRTEMTRLAAEASRRAEELEARIPISLAVQGQIAADSGRPGAVAEGIRLLEQAVSLPAPDTTPRLWLALLWIELGYPDRAVPLLERAREMDPLLGINAGALAVALGAQGEITEAEKVALQAVELNGLTFWGDVLAVNRYYGQGQESAAALLQILLDRLDPARAFEAQQTRAILDAFDDPEAQERLVSDWQDYGDTDIASLLFEQADHAFEAAPNDANRPWALILSAWQPAMNWLREDPRYLSLMASRGRVEYWEAHGYPRGCLPVEGPEGRHLDCPEPLQ